MARTVATLDRKTHGIMNSWDLLDLISEYMGDEMKEAIVEEMNEQDLLHADDEECIRELNDLCGKLSKHHREVCKELYEAKKELADLVCARELDRKAISDTAGKIGRIVSHEVGASHG